MINCNLATFEDLLDLSEQAHLLADICRALDLDVDTTDNVNKFLPNACISILCHV